MSAQPDSTADGSGAPGAIRPVAASDPVVVPTPFGRFLVTAWEFADGTEHLSATAVEAHDRPIGAAETAAPLVRLHSECLTGDVFGSFRCDCGPQLHQGLEMIAAAGGTLVYLRGHEGRGIGLVEKLRAYRLQDQGLDTVEANLALGHKADERRYDHAAAILESLGLREITLVTNNPAKAEALEELGIRVRELRPDQVAPGPENLRYLQTKRDRMRHLLDLPGEDPRSPIDSSTPTTD